MGGQTSSISAKVDELSIWEKFGVRLIGVDIKKAIDKPKTGEIPCNWMIEMGIPVCPKLK